MAEPAQEPQGAVPARPRVARVARTALMIQGLAWVAGICAAVFHWMETETIVPPVYCDIVFTVLLVWSLLLAVRSLVYRENSGLAVVVIAGFLFTVAVGSLIPWYLAWQQLQPGWVLCSDSPWARDALESGWPLFVPLVCLTTAFAASAAWWLTRKLERRAIARGKPAWGPWRWRKCWLVSFACLFLALTVGVWPFSFYFYAAETYGVPGYCYNQAKDWRSHAAKVTPAYVKYAVYRMVMALPLTPETEQLQDRLIESGGLPAPLLRPHLLGADEFRARASWEQMKVLCPHEMHLLATAIGKRAAKPQPLYTFHCDLAAEYIAHSCTVEERRAWIKGHASSPPEFIYSLLVNLQRKEDRGLFADDVIVLAKSNSPLRRAAMDALLGSGSIPGMANDEECERLWRSFASDPDPVRRREAVQVLAELDRPCHSKLLLLYLDDTDLLVRRTAIDGVPYQPIPPELEAIWTKRLLELLDDPDLALRRGAVHFLSEIPGQWPHRPLATPPGNSSNGTFPRFGGTPSPETQEEVEELKQVRAAAEEWLKKHEEPGAPKP